MTAAPIRVYYHLFNGPSWQPVWALHRAYLEPLLASGAVERLVVSCCGFADSPPALGLAQDRVELRMAARPAGRVNEFDTLVHLRRDCLVESNDFGHVAYLHSKGSSSARLTAQATSWADWLARALCAVLAHFEALAEAGFAAAGSNLAWGLFDPFERPRLHYSGNFWCATRRTISATQPIDLRTPEATVRHRAEWWLSTAGPAPFYNLFSSGLDHYLPQGALLNSARLDARIAALATATTTATPASALAQQEFVERHVQAVMPSTGGRRALSRAMLAVLPYPSIPRLYAAHDAVTKLLGSRRSGYFFCAET